MDFNSILNTVLGDKNVFFHSSNGNTIHIGDIIYDKTTKKRSVICPKCKTPTSEDTKEETHNYVAFTCLKCRNRFFEHDEVAQNISSYIDLNGQEAKEFQRLIEAINHDLHVGEAEYAYSRCQKNKEVYGKTPQIYEWGAFTLFLTRNIKYWIENSIESVIAYLEKSKQLDSNSLTYNRIAASIATRYYQGIMNHLEFTKLNTPPKPSPDKNMTSNEKQKLLDDYNSQLVLTRKVVFKYLMQIEICYKLFPDIDFIKASLNELYGYNGMAWFERHFSSFFKRPSDDPAGSVKLLKGYVWDFHKLTSNSDYIFKDEPVKPSKFIAKLEATLRKADPGFDFPEIRIGRLDSIPLSALASLNLFLICTAGICIGIAVGLWIFKWKWIACLFMAGIGFLVYKKDKDGNQPDHLRRLKNKYTGNF